MTLVCLPLLLSSPEHERPHWERVANAFSAVSCYGRRWCAPLCTVHSAPPPLATLSSPRTVTHSGCVLHVMIARCCAPSSHHFAWTRIVRVCVCPMFTRVKLQEFFEFLCTPLRRGGGGGLSRLDFRLPERRGRRAARGALPVAQSANSVHLALQLLPAPLH